MVGTCLPCSGAGVSLGLGLAQAPPRLAALPIGGPRIVGAELAAPKWRRTKWRRGRIGGAEMAAYELAAGTIGGAELTAPNWRRAEMAAQKGKYGKKGEKYTNKGLLTCLQTCDKGCFEQFRAVSNSFQQFRAVSSSFEQFRAVSNNLELPE